MSQHTTPATVEALRSDRSGACHDWPYIYLTSISVLPLAMCSNLGLDLSPVCRDLPHLLRRIASAVVVSTEEGRVDHAFATWHTLSKRHLPA